VRASAADVRRQRAGGGKSGGVVDTSVFLTAVLAALAVRGGAFGDQLTVVRASLGLDARVATIEQRLDGR
jgi:hypothetical protein